MIFLLSIYLSFLVEQTMIDLKLFLLTVIFLKLRAVVKNPNIKPSLHHPSYNPRKGVPMIKAGIVLSVWFVWEIWPGSPNSGSTVRIPKSRRIECCFPSLFWTSSLINHYHHSHHSDPLNPARVACISLWALCRPMGPSILAPRNQWYWLHNFLCLPLHPCHFPLTPPGFCFFLPQPLIARASHLPTNTSFLKWKITTFSMPRSTCYKYHWI